MHFPRLATLAFLCTSTVAIAAPTVTGNTISWPDDGWYQVQNASTYESVCGGTRSCTVDPGTYIVINHKTGDRFENIAVGSTDNPESIVTVSGNTISYSNKDWYQVQLASNYQSICEGVTSCEVESGNYIVINLTTGQRFTDVMVTGDVTTPPDAMNTVLQNVRVQYYSTSAAEIFWERGTSDVAISSVDVLRDGALLATVQGNSYFDGARTQNTNHVYTLIPVNSNEDRLTAIDIGQFEDKRLNNGQGTLAFNDYGEIALSGNTAVYTADRELLENGDSGAAYVYTRTAGSDWVQSQKIIGETGSEAFAFSVAINGNTLALGQRFIPELEGVDDNRGRVSVYEKNNNGDWQSAQTLDFVDNEPRVYRFGDYIAIDGNSMLISAANDINGDRVYAFNRGSDGIWSQTQKLEPSDQSTGSQFGSAIAINGDTAVIGSPSPSASSSAAYVFKRDSAGQWIEQQTLAPSINSDLDFIGDAVAINGNTIVVGQRYGNDAFVFSRNENGQWIETQILKPYIATNESSALRSGASVAIAENTLLVGSQWSSSLGYQTGAVAIYQKNAAGTWDAVNALAASDGRRDANFGQTVALDGATAMVGSFNPETADTHRPGRTAYIYTLTIE